jgi:glycosyltransferase involved in cell wall biosynthesis
MGISVTIQTHNRSLLLGQTLASLGGAEAAGEEFEVLVIDNGSTDATARVVEHYQSRFGGRLRYIYESRLGLSHARNRAVAEARHEIVAFLDDDVEVDPDWLRSLANAYRSGDFAAVGGKAYLIYPKSRPRWLGEKNEGLLTKVDLGPVRRLARTDELYGVNLSFKKEWFSRVGLFRSDLGRVGKCLLSSEEEDLLARIAQAGGRLLYEPAAIVGHRVAPERLRRRWFLSRIYWGKRGDARMVPESQISGYECLRSTWHVGLASWGLTRATLRHGPASQAAFQQSALLAGRVGFWVGLTGRLWSRFRLGTGGAQGHDTSHLQEHASPSSAPALPAHPDQHIVPSVRAGG